MGRAFRSMCGLSWWVPIRREPETMGSEPTTTRITARSCPLTMRRAPALTCAESVKSENPAAFARRSTSCVEVSALRETVR